MGNFIDVTNALSGYALNRLSPTQNLRLVYDVAKDGNWNSWTGNNGVFTDSYAEEHPVIAGLTNMALDSGGTFGKSISTFNKIGALWDTYTTIQG